MKSKIARILGVGLTVAVLASLLVVAAPSAPAATAAVGTLRFENIPLPKYPADGGNYVLAPAMDVGPIAVAPDGKTMFASVSGISTTNITDVLKSSDGGYTWRLQTGFRATTSAALDNSSVVGIKVSPQFATDGSVFVATEQNVYVAVDGGVAFTPMATLSTGTSGTGNTWTATEVIKDFDIALDKTGRLSVIVGTANTTAFGGGVYAYIPATTGLGWKLESQGSGWTAPSAADVYAVAFSPNFASDEGIFCVVSGFSSSYAANITAFRNSFGNTATAGGWNQSFTAATFRKMNRTGYFTVMRARIGFPSDFNPTSLTANFALVGLSDNDTASRGTATESGDMFKVTLSSIASSASDMTVRGNPTALTTTGTSVYSLAVSGPASALNILLTTDYSVAVLDAQGAGYSTVYRSSDGGATWASAYKPPRGINPILAGRNYGWSVIMAPDYVTSKVAYVGTRSSVYGDLLTGLYKTTNGGISFNGISLLDYGDTTYYYDVTGMVADPAYAKTQTMWLTTRAGGGALNYYYSGYGYYKDALWKTTNGGLTWEMVNSYASALSAMTNGPNLTADGAIYLYDPNSLSAGIPYGKFWRSTDGGSTWLTVIYAKAANFAAVYFVNKDTIWTAYPDATSGSTIWSTSNSGLSWVKPDQNIVTGTPNMFAFSGSIVLLSTCDGTGRVFISTDAGKTFLKQLGVTPAGLGTAYVSFDPGYATNKFVYCTIANWGGGVWRIAVNEAAPDTTSWKQIDGDDDYWNVIPTNNLDIGGVFYVWDNAWEDIGIWRSVNPRDDPDSLYPPRFEHVEQGLTYYHEYAFVPPVSYSMNPNTLFVRDLDYDAYYNQLLGFADTLSAPVALKTPADKAKDIGTSSSTISLYMDVGISWTAVTGATWYYYQVSTDSAFVSLVADDEVAATTEEILGTFLPGNTYYWRVMVEEPLFSPWSAVRTFTVAQPYALQLKIISPASGATDVAVMPTFAWSAVPGVTTYEVVVSQDPTFAVIEWSRTSDKPQFTADQALAYGTTYNWRVRPAGGAWVYGVFTTMAKPTTPAPPITITSVPAPTITVVPGPTTEAVPGYLLWIIIAIGAILVIALIVLIVRTRRSA